jgi:hypothetical protein
MAARMPEMSIPALSNMPPLEPKSFCISTTMTAVLAGSMASGPGLAANLKTPGMRVLRGTGACGAQAPILHEFVAAFVMRSTRSFSVFDHWKEHDPHRHN